MLIINLYQQNLEISFGVKFTLKSVFWSLTDYTEATDSYRFVLLIPLIALYLTDLHRKNSAAIFLSVCS